MRQIQTFVEYVPMNGLFISEIKQWVGDIKRARMISLMFEILFSALINAAVSMSVRMFR